MIQVDMPYDDEDDRDRQRNRQGQRKRHTVAHNNFKESEKYTPVKNIRLCYINNLPHTTYVTLL